jgi:hypothetical protein
MGMGRDGQMLDPAVTCRQENETRCPTASTSLAKYSDDSPTEPFSRFCEPATLYILLNDILEFVRRWY